MPTQAILDQLIAFEAGQDEVVSAYFNADTSQLPIETIKLQVRSMLKELGESYAEDAERIEHFFEHLFDWHKPGVALFSCAPQGFFESYQAAVPFRNRIRLGAKPYVKPLLHFAKNYANYGVILIDRIGARMLEFHLGELQETAGTTGEEIRKQKHGGGSSAAGMRGGQGAARQEDEHAQRNMRAAAEQASRFFAGKSIRRLFLGGTAENIAQFREMLPKQLQSCLAASFPMDMDASEQLIRERTLAILQDLNTERERRLVEQMVTGAAREAMAVTGLAPTLRMVSDGRVETLILSDGFHAPGYRHASTGYLAMDLEDALFVDDTFEPVTDVVAEAVNHTVAQGGHVEVIAENPALERAGRIGALLRY